MVSQLFPVLPGTELALRSPFCHFPAWNGPHELGIQAMCSARHSTWYFPSHGKWNSAMESELWGNRSLSFVNVLTRFPPTFLSLLQAGCALSPSLPAPVFLLCKGKKVSGKSDWTSDVIGWETPRLNLCVFNYLWRHKRLWSRPSMSRCSYSVS